MTNTRAISYPVALTPAELAFLLSLVGAQTLEGLEHEALFPENATARERLFLHGRSELQRDEWLIQVSGTTQYDLNDQLVAVIAAMAAPQVVLVTTLDTPGQPRQSVTHFVSNVVVEAVFDGDRYMVTGLQSTEVLLARLANTIGLPQKRLPLKSFELPAEKARQAVSEPRAERLLDLGVPAESTQALETALAGGRQRANVRVTSMHYGEVKAVHRLQVLVSDNDSAYLAIPVDDTGVRFSPASAEDFAEEMRALIQTP